MTEASNTLPDQGAVHFHGDHIGTACTVVHPTTDRQAELARRREYEADHQGEQSIRIALENRRPTNRDDVRFLLRLLDAERARADAAERSGAVKALRSFRDAFDSFPEDFDNAIVGAIADERAANIENGVDF